MSGLTATLAPTFSPTYAVDTDATAAIKIHKQGYCPKHPDIKIFRKRILSKSIDSPCPRCADLHEKNMEQISALKGSLSTLGGDASEAETSRLKSAVAELEGKNSELEEIILSMVREEKALIKATRQKVFAEKLKMKNILLNSLNLRRIKIVILGEGRVGKTCIMKRYLKNEFAQREVSTFQASYLEYADDNVHFSVWDTAGQERFHALAPIYYRDADLAMLVYDITDAESFVKVKSWCMELRKMQREVPMPIFVVGNKIDLERNRGVNEAEVLAYCKGRGYKHHHVSAKDDTGVDECFTDMVVSVALSRQVQNTGANQQTIKLTPGEPQTRRSKCC